MSHFTDLVKDIDIIDELDIRGITGNRSGNNYMIQCPFHGERNPSFGIKLEGEKKGLYNCLSANCNAHGNFFHLISELDGISFQEAIQKFAKEEIDVSEIISLESHFKKAMKFESKGKTVKVISDRFLKFFTKPYGRFLKYLIKERKLTKRTIKKFGILCCDTSNDKVDWRERIIIPIRDTKGRLISLTARKIYETDKRKKVRKLVGSHVKTVLFGLGFLKKDRPIVLVEGEFDTIYLQQFKVPAVGLGSADVSDTQLSKLILYASSVFISLDGEVGEQALIRLKEKVSSFIPTTILRLPKNKDPNNLTEKEIKKIYQEVL